MSSVTALPGALEQHQSSAEWQCYFADNREHLLPVLWDCPYRLSRLERKAIEKSIRQFQLGESSDGHHLRRLAQEWVRKTGDTDYVKALELFIAEENRHAVDLGRFMQIEQMPLATSDWVDSIFRHLRRLTTLEQAVVVLVTAEIIACVYYKALHDATRSPILRQICKQILHDEPPHVRFQRDTLFNMRAGRGGFLMGISSLLEEILFSGTLLVVWVGHRQAFRAGGIGFRNYWRRCWRAFSTARRNTHN